MSIYKNVPSWKARSSLSAKAIFESPQKLYDACLEYFEWIEVNPLIEHKVGFSNGDACKAEIPRLRAMTVRGLVLFLGTTRESWYKWKKERSDLAPVQEWAEGIIWNQKFEGASAGLLSSAIIIRELGLAEKHQHDISAPGMTINPPSGDMPEQPPIHE